MSFLKLLKFLSLKNSLYNNTKYIEFSKVKNRPEIEKNLINFEELRKVFNIDSLEAIKLIYFNRDSIHKILYEKEYCIILEDLEQNLSFYFYLILLIQENEDIVNYKYSINYIKNVINLRQKANSKNEIKLLLAKIIYELIKNYIAFEDKNDEIKKIENENNEIITEIDSKIFSLKIENLYIDIILNLIKNNQFEEILIIEIGIESINITKIIFEQIQELLDNNKDINREYLIKEENDLFNTKKINFNYNILKYLLKESIFIYQIDFFLKTKKFFLSLYYNNKSNFFNNYKLNYIRNRILDLEYFIKKRENFKFNNSNIKNETNKSEESNKSINTEKSKDNDKNEESNKSINTKTYESEESDKSEDSNKSLKITKKEEINKSQNTKTYESEERNKSEYTSLSVENDNKSKNYSENNNSKFLTILNNNDSIKKENEKDNNERKYTADFITETNQYFISGGTNSLINIYDKSYNLMNKKINIEDWAYNIIEDDTKIIICCKKNLYLISDKKLYKDKYENTFLNSNSIFLIKNNEQNNSKYFFCCENNFCYVKEDIFNLWSPINNILIRDNILIKSGIKINNDILILKSNKIASKGEDKLYICDINKEKKELKEIELGKGYSFIFSSNGIEIMPFNNDVKENKKKYVYKPIDKNNSKILLCCCKKYIKKQENGILLLNIKNDEIYSKDNEHYFFNTNSFEVYCICPLLKYKYDSILKERMHIEDTFYFLVGGFEPNKYRGLIKLFRLNYYKESLVNKIEYIQDIFTEFENFKFKAPISSIIQTQQNGNILITCWNGNVYSLNSPEIEYYLKYNTNYENENMLYNNFFNKKKF